MQRKTAEVQISLKGWAKENIKTKKEEFLRSLPSQKESNYIVLVVTQMADSDSVLMLRELLKNITRPTNIQEISFLEFPNEIGYSSALSQELSRLKFLAQLNIQLKSDTTDERVSAVIKSMELTRGFIKVSVTVKRLQLVAEVKNEAVPMDDEMPCSRGDSVSNNNSAALNQSLIVSNNSTIVPMQNVENKAGDRKDERPPLNEAATLFNKGGQKKRNSKKRPAESMQSGKGKKDKKEEKSRKKPKVVKSTQAGTDYGRSPFERYIDELMRDGHMPHGKQGIPVSGCVGVWELLIAEHIPEEVRVRRHYRGELARRLTKGEPLPQRYHPISLSGQKQEMVPYPEKLIKWGETIKLKIGKKDTYSVDDVDETWESLVEDSKVSKEECVDFPLISQKTRLKLMFHMSYCDHLAQNPEQCRKILASSPKGWAELLASEYGPDAPAGMEIDSEGSSLGNSSSSSNNSNSNSSNSTLLNSSTLFDTHTQPHLASSLNALPVVGQRKGAS